MAEFGFRLRVTKGPDAGTEVVVLDPSEGPLQVGRDVNPDSDLLLNDAKVSRHHATIELGERGLVITDHGSTNRTRINGRLIRPNEAEPLSGGEEIAFGPDTTVVFELVQARPSAPSPEAQQPRYEFGHYGIYDALCKGDIDRVDVAVDLRTKKRVALKRFANDLSRVIKRRILDQAEHARTFQHPNIAQICDVGQVDDVAYIASRLVDGLSLATIQERAAREIQWPFACYIIREACAALSYGQRKEPGLVLRNLSPRSIMIDYTGEVLLINFAMTPVQAMRTGTVKLNPKQAYYLAPEHRAQRALEPRCDIYSLGVILYELLTRESIDPRRLTALPEIDTICPDLPPELARLTMQAVAQHPEDRIQRVADMEAQLTTALNIMAPRFGPAEVAAWMIRTRLGAWS